VRQGAAGGSSARGARSLPGAATVDAVSLPREVDESSARYLAHAGDHVRAAFVIGSAALGDWWPGSSDIDMVALVASADPAHDAQLREIHARVRADLGKGAAPDLEVLYLTDGDLAQAPARVGARAHHRDGLLRRDTDMTTPVIWHSLAQHSVPVAGSVDLSELWLDDVELRAWCRSNLDSYWTGWATRGAQTATRGGMALLTDWAVAWCVLGVLRLRHTIDTGLITSKSGGGRWALSALALDPGERALVEEALALRAAGADGTAGVDRTHAARRRDRTVAFMRRIIDEAR
jgi:predicted nucleotidyltransferase